MLIIRSIFRALLLTKPIVLPSGETYWAEDGAAIKPNALQGSGSSAAEQIPHA